MSDEQVVPVQIKKSSISPLWLFTLIAIILGGWLIYKSFTESGTRISILFQNAQGIEAGRTAMRYQGLEVGIVRKVALSEDLNGVIAEAEVFPQAKQLLSKDTLFWIVKPKASLTGISGLDALVGGNYIAVLPGKELETAKEFVAAPNPPNIVTNQDSLLIYLTTNDLASLSIGSGVYYKKIQVGEVFNYELKEDEQNVLLSVKIEEKYTHLVKNNSRFWNISGIKADIDLHGANIEIGNLPSLLAGGIAFDSPQDGKSVRNDKEFQLYPSINKAQRGIEIRIALPVDHGIKNDDLAITYKGSEVGRLKSIEFNQTFNGFTAIANIDPSMRWLLKTGTEFTIEQPELSLSNVKNLSHFVTGNTLSITPGEGDEQLSFSAKTPKETIVSQNETLKISLTTDDAWGISSSTKIVFKGIDVGFVYKHALVNDKVRIDIVVNSAYRHLVKSHSRFYRLGGISGSIGKEGLEFSVAPAAQLAQSAISFTSQGSNKIAKSYLLYDSKSQALKAKSSSPGFKTFTLVTDTLPSISEGSPVMYKNVTVGQVKNFKLEKNGVLIQLDIENQYQHLVTQNTVFWNHSGIGVKADFSGLSVQAASLQSIISGGISFGELKGISNKKGNNWLLYPSLTEAQNQGFAVTFNSKMTHGLKIGSSISYQGVEVGKITEILPKFENQSVQINATIYSQFAKNLAKANSYFWVSLPKISLSKAENLDSLFAPYISVIPGNGNTKSNFTLHESQQYIGGLSLVLETKNRDSINVGTPILFRDFEVGSVTDVRLGHFADRVLIEVKILSKYRHLVRSNSVFWNHSGLDITIGLTGAEIKTGTAETLIRGGIVFATPEGKALAPMAKANQRFLLHQQPKDEWKIWSTAIPPLN